MMAGVHRQGEFQVQGGDGRKDFSNSLGAGVRHGDYDTAPRKESGVESGSREDQRLNGAWRTGKISNGS